MLVAVMGVALIFFAVNQATVVEDYPTGYVHYEHPTQQGPVVERDILVKPVSEFRYRNVVRQAYDYSCGSAALTTILNHYLGRQFEERQIMEGLLRFGERERIIERRGFSLLDMRRLATALGHPSGGFRAEIKDLRTLDHPAIVPISYGGFKHFVVLREYRDGHIHVADPALGNISFTESKFEEVWEQNVLFIVFPNGFEPQQDLELTDYDLRMIDEQTINQLAFREFPVFTRPMEQWADKAGTLNAVLITDDDDVERVINVPTRTYFRRK
ncbi:C39 family peptidase [Alcanivorax sp. JB21]|uniref:C39 family peptidase n=1 Tax=Alcanivorax limicola TaxID=2874102 RepID=UPI001CC0AE15|nr:C39 family peptidase [Alcanivorax limicola]MBZ2187945.1 C39 family peptidase [Alcanivorax limicola]